MVNQGLSRTLRLIASSDKRGLSMHSPGFAKQHHRLWWFVFLKIMVIVALRYLIFFFIQQTTSIFSAVHNRIYFLVKWTDLLCQTGLSCTAPHILPSLPLLASLCKPWHLENFWRQPCHYLIQNKTINNKIQKAE